MWFVEKGQYLIQYLFVEANNCYNCNSIFLHMFSVSTHDCCLTVKIFHRTVVLSPGTGLNVDHTNTEKNNLSKFKEG